MPHSLLEKIVDERVGQTLVGTVSLAVDRIAEAIAREALADPTFRRTLHELVRVRSQALLDELMRNGTKRGRRPARARRSDRKSTRLNSSHSRASRMPSSA